MVNNKIKTQDIINGIGAGLCLLDRDFRIVWVNKYQSDWFGSSQELYGRHCYRMFQRRNKVCPGCPTKRALKTGNVEVAKSARGYTADGQKHYYQLTVSPIKDNSGSVVFALELVQDVTDRIVQERLNLRINHRLKRMCQHLHLVNNKLSRNIDRLKSISRDISGSKRNIENKYRKKKNELIVIKEELRDIFKINRTLASTVDFKKISALITRLTCELMHTDTCVLRLLSADKKRLFIHSSHCMSNGFIKGSSDIRVGEGIAGIVARTKRPVSIYDIDRDRRVKFKELMKREGLRSAFAVPVIYQGKILGIISTGSKKERHFLEEEIEVLKIFASQVAVAIQESRHYDDIRINYYNTVHTLVLTLEARDPYTRGHTERVTKFAIEIAKALKLHQKDLEIIRYAAEVHDIGKINIPDFILNKPGKLNPAERAMVELHPVKGTEILELLEFLKPALPVVRHHHERYDGTGYPDGLEKEQIPLMSRILACADAFDAMTSDRPYRRRNLSIQEALAEIKNNAGSQFDPDIARLFIKTIRKGF